MRVDIHWISVFADVPVGWLQRELRFWSAAVGAAPGTRTGDHGEFVPLVPAAGDRYVYLQAVGRDVGGWHPDLYVRDGPAAVDAAERAGARVVRAGRPLSVLETPAGQPFCLYEDAGGQRRRPDAPTWPGVGRSLADQLCLDIPFDAYDAECAFWSALTGWPGVAGGRPEFRRVNPPGELPVQFLLQRLRADDDGGARSHLDMSADEPAAEVARHVRLGADVAAEFPHWTTLRDPAGLTYCVTHRRPYTPSR